MVINMLVGAEKGKKSLDIGLWNNTATEQWQQGLSVHRSSCNRPEPEPEVLHVAA